MNSKPLIQTILEEDLIIREEQPSKGLHQLAEEIAKVAGLPFDNNKAASHSLNRFSSFSDRPVFQIAAESDIPGIGLIDKKQVKSIARKTKLFLTRLENSTRTFDSNENEIISTTLSEYYDQILDEINKLPRILCNALFQSFGNDRTYNTIGDLYTTRNIGTLARCIHPKFIKLCKALSSKMFSKNTPFDTSFIFLSAVIRNIVIRKLSHVVPKELIDLLKEANKHAMFMFILSDNIFYTKNKIALISLSIEKNKDVSRFVLHNQNGPAFKTEKSQPAFFIRGRFCQEWILTCSPKDIKDKITQFFNLDVEQRRMVLERLGPKPIIQALGAETLDTKDEYKLIEVKHRRFLGGRGRFLQMRNPSIRTDYHLEGVSNKCETVDDALRWRNHDAETMPVALS